MINYVLVVYGFAISLLGIGQPQVSFITNNKHLKYAGDFRRYVN